MVFICLSVSFSSLFFWLFVLRIPGNKAFFVWFSLFIALTQTLIYKAGTFFYYCIILFGTYRTTGKFYSFSVMLTLDAVSLVGLHSVAVM